MTTGRIRIPDTPMDILRAYVFHQADTQHDIVVRLDTQSKELGYQFSCLHCPPDWIKTISHRELVDLFGFEPENMVDTLSQAMEEMARRLPGGPPTAWARLLKGLDL